MRCMKRNGRCFYYALFKEKTPIVDDEGNETGENKVVYTHPKKFHANISAATGEAQTQQFGSAVDYDRVIVTDDMSCPIDENSVLCIDCPPTYDGEGNLVYDYIVKKVAKSLNSISYAVSKVKVS